MILYRQVGIAPELASGSEQARTLLDPVLSAAVTEDEHGRLPASAGYPRSTVTITLADGISPETAADRLGHHSPAFTLERYTHAVRALDDDAADRLQAALTAARRKASAS